MPPPPLIAQEQQFLARFPDYTRILDPERERQHVLARFASVQVRQDPFPYVWVEGLLTSELYELVENAWPDVEGFPPADRDNRRDLVPRPPGTNPSDKRAANYDELPPALRAVWNFFVLEVNRAIVGPWLAQVFAEPIGGRLSLIEGAWRAGRVSKDYYAPPYEPRMNVGRLMMRAEGFRLRPHADALPYLVTALYYFPHGEAADDLGTTLYRTTAALDENTIVEDDHTAYFRDAGIAATPVFHAPFRRNALLAFANTLRSAHGMEITTPGIWRRAYQSHLSIKRDHHHL